MRSELLLKRSLTFVASLFVGLSVQSQVATTYNFSQSVGTYTPITGGTVIASTGMGNMDDDVIGITIPAFSFDGVSYTSAYVHTNGYLTFGSVSDLDYAPISSTYAYAGVISAFGADLNQAQAAAGTRNISTLQVGNEFVIQWQNVRRYAIAGERISFQIRLNTVTNAINIVYGGTIIPGDDIYDPEVGLRGPDNTFATNVNNREVISTTGAWNNSVPGTSATSTCFFNSSDPATVPAAGTTFTWTAGPDISASLLTFSTSNDCYGNSEVVSLVLTNTGGSVIDFSVTPVTINGAVSGTNPATFAPITINTGTLAINGTQTVQLSPAYDMSTGGASYVFNATISMTGDSRPLNNALTSTIMNRKPSVSYADLSTCSGEAVTLTGTTSTSPYPKSISNTTALPITDDDAAGVFSSIVISDAGTFPASDVTVTITNLEHTYTSDLTISLIAPDGSSIELAWEVGSDANFVNTVFSDDAAEPIYYGDNPFTGTFQPEYAFSDLTGSANGTWQLHIVDNYAADEGTLYEWSISYQSTNSIVSYNWTPATGLSSATVSNPDAILTATETYTVTVTDERGCTATDEVEIAVNQPTVTASSDAAGNTICDGESVTLTASGDAVSYTWNNGVTNGTAFEPATTASYVVTGTDANNCTNTDTITITVNPAPNTALALTTTEFCENHGVQTLSGGTPAGGTYSGTGVSGGVFTPSTAGEGTFTITYTVTQNNCTASATDEITVDECLGLDEAAQSVIEVYPNPGKGVFTISATDADQLANLAIRDAQGKSISFDQHTSGTAFVIDLTHVENGIYFLTGTLNGTQFVSRLVKQ